MHEKLTNLLSAAGSNDLISAHDDLLLPSRKNLTPADDDSPGGTYFLQRGCRWCLLLLLLLLDDDLLLNRALQHCLHLANCRLFDCGQPI